MDWSRDWWRHVTRIHFRLNISKIVHDNNYGCKTQVPRSKTGFSVLKSLKPVFGFNFGFYINGTTRADVTATNCRRWMGSYSVADARAAIWCDMHCWHIQPCVSPWKGRDPYVLKLSWNPRCGTNELIFRNTLLYLPPLPNIRSILYCYWCVTLGWSPKCNKI